MTDVREKLTELLRDKFGARTGWAWPDVADAILAAHPELTPPSGSEAVEAARRIVAARGIDWKMPEGDWIEKDGYICARYILSLAPDKDVVEAAGLAAKDAFFALKMRTFPVTAADAAEDIATLQGAIAALATARAAREMEKCADFVDDFFIRRGKHINSREVLACEQVAAAIRRRTP